MNGRTRVTHLCIVSFLLLGFAALCGPPAAAGSGNDVRIGVQADRGHEEALRAWGPTADYLAAALPGRSFTIVPLDAHAIGPAVGYGNVEFVIADNSVHVQLEALYGATRIATMKDRTPKGATARYGAVIFCRADRSDIKTLDDLKGKTFMAVHPSSFSGWSMAWREFLRSGINPLRSLGKLDFAGTHEGVVMAVRDGGAEAGTARTGALERLAEKGVIRLSDFRILNERPNREFPLLRSTELYPERPFLRVKHAPDDLAQQVAVALLQMQAQSSAALSAQIAGWTVPLDYAPVYGLMKELRLGPYGDESVSLKTAVSNHRYGLGASVLLLLLVTALLLHARRANKKREAASRAHAAEIAEHGRREFALSRAAAASARSLAAAQEAAGRMQDALDRKSQDLHGACEQLRAAQAQLAGQEQLVEFGRRALDAVHDVNDPLVFMAGNLATLRTHIDKLCTFIDVQSHALDAVAVLEEPELLEAAAKRMELNIDYVLTDLGNLIRECLEDAERADRILRNLRTSSSSVQEPAILNR